MPLAEPIGGYFELELPPPGPWLHDGALLLNTGRACFEHVLRTVQPAHVHLPKFTCDVMLEPLERTNTAYSFYGVTPGLEIAGEPEVRDGEMLVYTNYFGVMDRYCRDLADRLGRRLVLDCSQALYFAPPPGVHTFYSPRKFVGVPDGGCLYTEAEPIAGLARDVSFERYSHLTGRLDLGAEGAYACFKSNDESLVGEGIKRISGSTERLLQSLDYERIREIRRANFTLLDSALGLRNNLRLDLSLADCPMVYPYLCDESGLRERLIAEKVFVPTYWPNVLRWCRPDERESQLATNLLPLPIDQRYGKGDMERVLSLLS
jgi:hypothetical protein